MPIDPPPADLLSGASLFLDFDGTLVELAERPDAVVVNDRLPPLLRRLAVLLDGRVAIVSGRPAGQVAGYLGRGLSISGSHGVEFAWADGRVEAPEPPGWVGAAVVRAEALRRDHPGVVIEAKPYGVAVHYRMAPDAEAASHAFAQQLAREEALVLQPGKMVFEVRVAGSDKGDALRTFMADPAMAGTAPVFIGDDVTDEAAFAAATQMGGCGILVGPDKSTGARFRLGSVAETIGWLEAATGEIA